MGDSFLAVDIGSSFVKSAVLDLRDAAVKGIRSVSTPPRLPHRNPRHYEVDIGALFGIVADTIATRTEEHGAFAGLLLSTQTHGFVLADDAGTPLTQYVSWQDQRSLDAAPDGEVRLDRLRRLLDPSVMAASGIELKPGLALSSLDTWMSEHGEHYPNGEGLVFFTLGGYLIWRLTGVHACHLTNAAATGFVDIERRRWNTPLLEALGLARMRLPALESEAAPVGRHEVVGGGRLPVYADIGDHHATILGCLLRPKIDVCVNIATAAQLTSITTQIERGPYEIRPFFERSYLKTATGIPSGRNLDVLVNFVADVGVRIFGCELTAGEVWRRVNEMPRGEIRGGLSVSTGFFEGTVGVSEGAIHGIGPNNLDAAAMFEAAYRNIAQTYATLLERMEPDARRLLFAGGVARKNKALRRAVVEATGRESRFAPFEDEVFVGLLRLALVAAGRCATLGDTEALLCAGTRTDQMHQGAESV